MCKYLGVKKKGRGKGKGRSPSEEEVSQVNRELDRNDRSQGCRGECLLFKAGIIGITPLSKRDKGCARRKEICILGRDAATAGVRRGRSETGRGRIDTLTCRRRYGLL